MPKAAVLSPQYFCGFLKLIKIDVVMSLHKPSLITRVMQSISDTIMIM